MYSRVLKAGFIGLIALSLTACVAATTPLPAALTASMAKPNAVLNQTEALGLINQYRSANGLPTLTLDPELSSLALKAANQYAKDANNNGATALVASNSQASPLFSAGYSNFADTFSGWRGSPRDAKTLAQTNAKRAGLAVMYAPNTSFGTHWVLLVSP